MRKTWTVEGTPNLRRKACYWCRLPWTDCCVASIDSFRFPWPLEFSLANHYSTITKPPFPPPLPDSTPTIAMRLFLIPISTRRTLIYSRPLGTGLAKDLSITDRITNKAAETWAKWEEADKGWKKHLVSWGNRMQQRIPFEEWGLKSIPSLNAQRRINKSDADRKVDFLFPGNAIRREKLPSILQRIALERQDLHRKRMYWSFIVAPFTAPIALIPVYVACSSRKSQRR